MSSYTYAAVYPPSVSHTDQLLPRGASTDSWPAPQSPRARRHRGERRPIHRFRSSRQRDRVVGGEGLKGRTRAMRKELDARQPHLAGFPRRGYMKFCASVPQTSLLLRHRGRFSVGARGGVRRIERRVVGQRGHLCQRRSPKRNSPMRPQEMRLSHEPEPKIDGRPGRSCRGTLIKPIRNVRDVVFKLRPQTDTGWSRSTR